MSMKLLAPNRTRRLLLHNRLRRPRLRRRAPFQVPVGRQVLSVGHHWLGSRRPVPQRGGDQQRDEADDWQKPRQREPPRRIALGHASTTRPASWEITSYGRARFSRTTPQQGPGTGSMILVQPSQEPRESRACATSCATSAVLKLVKRHISASWTAALDASLA